MQETQTKKAATKKIEIEQDLVWRQKIQIGKRHINQQFQINTFKLKDSLLGKRIDAASALIRLSTM